MAAVVSVFVVYWIIDVAGKRLCVKTVIGQVDHELSMRVLPTVLQ